MVLSGCGKRDDAITLVDVLDGATNGVGWCDGEGSGKTGWWLTGVVIVVAVVIVGGGVIPVQDLSTLVLHSPIFLTAY